MLSSLARLQKHGKRNVDICISLKVLRKLIKIHKEISTEWRILVVVVIVALLDSLLVFFFNGKNFIPTLYCAWIAQQQQHQS